MFNREKKEAFAAASYPSNKRDEVLGLLELFSSYEDSWHGDLVKQPIGRLQPAFDEVAKTIAVKKARNLLTILKKYREWYLSESGVKAVYGGVLLLKLNTDDRLRSNMVASPMYLKFVLDEVFEDPALETADCIYRALMWLAFAGVPREAAPQIAADEVDFHDMVIRHGGIEYKIYREGLRELQKLCELDSFRVIRTNPSAEQRRARLEGNQLIRGLGSTVIMEQRISMTLSGRFQKSKWSLTYENVSDSGMFYEKYEQEIFGTAVSFDEVVEQRLDAMQGLDNAARIRNRNMIKSRLNDKYVRWKAVFYAQTQE